MCIFNKDKLVRGNGANVSTGLILLIPKLEFEQDLHDDFVP
jgi:hypothetical protein